MGSVLMISLGDEMLHHPEGEPVRRHLAYANRSQLKINLVVRSRVRQSRSWHETLAVYPTGITDYLRYPWRAFQVAAGIVSQERPSLVTTQDPFGTALVGWWLKKRFRLPWLVQNHSSFIDNAAWIGERPLLFRFFNWLAKRLLPLADAYRVVNQTEKEIYVNQLGLPADKIQVLPVPVDVEHITQFGDTQRVQALRQRLGIAAEAPTLLWVGRPVRVKRIPFLFGAFQKILTHFPTARLLLIGNPNQMQEDLQGLQASLGLHNQVIWTGYVPHHDLPVYYALADLYVHTSSYEGFGRVLVEAAAAGLPVVTTRNAGAEMIIQDGETGYLTSPDEIDHLVQKVCLLLRDRRHRLQMGQAARQHALDTFNPGVMLEAIVAQWHSLISTGEVTNE